jgi:hypothetical protein
MTNRYDRLGSRVGAGRAMLYRDAVLLIGRRHTVGGYPLRIELNRPDCCFGWRD